MRRLVRDHDDKFIYFTDDATIKKLDVVTKTTTAVVEAGDDAGNAPISEIVLDRDNALLYALVPTIGIFKAKTSGGTFDPVYLGPRMQGLAVVNADLYWTNFEIGIEHVVPGQRDSVAWVQSMSGYFGSMAADPNTQRLIARTISRVTTSGTEAPVVIARWPDTGMPQLQGFLVDDTSVYWVVSVAEGVSNGITYKASKCGGPTRVVTTDTATWISGLTEHGDYLYFSRFTKLARFAK